ncbi:hypothetical protein F5Y19DRAFT_264145 [Xylariaceae sp. FL1651]|nr:hypothetical protein F5Y19DRAFT_264145 [Xylariaceae sp. FL1651]
MLPSRGLLRANPTSAFRHSLSSRTKPVRTSALSTRQFSQVQSPSQSSSVLSRRLLVRPTALRYGQLAPSVSSIGCGDSVGIASSVFAQRTGASRNLSLWPFQSNSTPPTPAETPSEWPATSAAETQPPIIETSTLPTPSENASNTAASPIANQTHTSQLPDDLLREFDPQSFLDLPERIGFLKELGLNFGWGPTACCEWLLEHIHVYSGMPWWGSIAAMAILFRAVMFYPTLSGAKHQAKLQRLHSNPAWLKAKADFDEAAWRTKDQAAMLVARSEMNRLMKQSGTSFWRPFVSFALFPFTYGMFRLVRNMAAIPVPSMETGGLAWFTDLTIHDPFFILPCVSVGLAVLMLKQTQRANMRPNPMQETMMKAMIYIMPPLMFLGTAWLPAGLQWFFLVLSLGSVAQTQATITPVIRRWAQLPPLPDADNVSTNATIKTHSYQAPTPASSGLGSSLRDGMTAASKTLKEATGTTEDKTRWKKAQDYEEKRAEEERQKAFRRMEDVRRRRIEQEQ